MKPLYWISLFAGIGLSGVTALQFSPVKEGINWLRARDAYYLGGAAWSEGFCPKAIEYFDQSIIYRLPQEPTVNVRGSMKD